MNLPHFNFQERPLLAKTFRPRVFQGGNKPAAAFTHHNFSSNRIVTIAEEALKRFVTLFNEPDSMTNQAKRSALVRARLDFIDAQDALRNTHKTT